MFDELNRINLQDMDEEGSFLPVLPMGNDSNEELPDFPGGLPILPLKNTLIFPGVVMPIVVGRISSQAAVQRANKGDKYIGVFAQKDSNVEEPIREDLYDLGCIAKIIKMIKMPDGTNTVILQGKRRCELLNIIDTSPCLSGNLGVIEELPLPEDDGFYAIVESIRELAEKMIRKSPNVPNEASFVLGNIEDPYFLMNFIASNLNINVEGKQVILEINEPLLKAEKVLQLMHQEMQFIDLKDQIESKVKVDLDKQQRDYYLSQQLKTIQDELGQNPHEEELKKLIEKASTKKWSDITKAAFDREVTRLKRINPASPDYGIMMNYLELLVELPWNEYTEDNFDLKKAEEILDTDQFGLDKVKKRILEHLAVLKLKGDMKAPILCLAGPPGVGKTSLGASIAKALNRQYIRMSLGGLHDEAEIRGHRKTYIGALPGRIIQNLRKAKSANPVFILDEIDKVGKDFRGDPTSALLEVLDPQQNFAFHDNYLDLDFDLSKVMFIATANYLASIQPALLDRMELIEVEGYSIEEKVEIAKLHLLPKQMLEHGLDSGQVSIGPDTLKALIAGYTRESGVRELDRQLAALMRYVAKNVVGETHYNPDIKPEELEEILGHAKYNNDIYQDGGIPGVAVGLAWTQVGGDILFIEASLSAGTGQLALTGNLGDVMKESATTALSFIKANAEQIGIDPELFTKKNIHIHIPAGAIPKDGPSAGITMMSAITSAFLNKPIKSKLAMTGEITLRGRVLPVGGIKEKVLAAKRADIKEIILCDENKKDVLDITQRYIEGVQFHYVNDMFEVLRLAIG